MPELSDLKCVPCRGDSPAVPEDERGRLLLQIPLWNIVEFDGIATLERTFRFKNFAQALAFTNQVGKLAEVEDHHPRLQTEWGTVKVIWWTHAIKDLHQNDFIMAARTDQLYTDHKSIY